MTDNLFGNPEGAQPAAQTQAPAQEPAPQASPQEPQAPAPQTTDPNSVFANQLAGIKSDDGRQKYADVNTALASIPHAQDHIRTLTQKNAELEQEIAKRAGIEDVLQRIESQPKGSDQPSVTGMDETAVNALVEQTLAQREQAQVAQANQAKVINTLTEKYGEKAEEMFIAKANQLGVDVGFLTQIALQSPQAALAYFNESTPSPANPTTPGVNTTAMKPNAEPQEDYMKIFNGGESDLVNKWRNAAKS